MAQTEFSVNHPLARKTWAKELAREALEKTYVGKFIGTGDGSLIQERTDLKKDKGDRITCGLRVQLRGDGVIGDATLEGSTEAMDFFDDSVVINQLRHGVNAGGKMSRQRVLYDMRAEALAGLSDWWADRLDDIAAVHLAGYALETRSAYNGHNAVQAPSTSRIIRAGSVANDSLLTTDHRFTLSMIDRAKVRAKTVSTKKNTGPLIRPIKYMGGDYYVMFLHPFQVHDLRTNVSTGQWMDIQKAAMQGGDVEKNPIFSGALGIYNGVVLHEWERLPNGYNGSSAATSTRRAVFAGAQAMTVAFGAGGSDTRFDWREEDFDFGNRLEVAAGLIFGMKKTRFVPADDSATNAEDFGTIVVSTFAADPNA